MEPGTLGLEGRDLTTEPTPPLSLPRDIRDATCISNLTSKLKKFNMDEAGLSIEAGYHRSSGGCGSSSHRLLGLQLLQKQIFVIVYTL